MLASHGTRGRAAHQFAAQKAGEKTGKIRKDNKTWGKKKDGVNCLEDMQLFEWKQEEMDLLAF